jgi:hypothetical protein
VDKPARKLRSQAWFEGAGKNVFMYRSWMKNQDFPNRGCDLDFLVGCRGAPIPAHSH